MIAKRVQPKFFQHSKFRNKIWKKTNGVCWYCGISLLPYGSESSSYVIDHIISVNNGGTDDDENLVPCCVKCNSKKREKSIEQFRIWIGNNHTFWFEQL